jgi:hypothetical protein
VGDDLAFGGSEANGVEIAGLFRLAIVGDFEQWHRDVDAELLRQLREVPGRGAGDRLGKRGGNFAGVSFLDGPAFEVPVRLEILREVARDGRLREDYDFRAVFGGLGEKRGELLAIGLDGAQARGALHGGDFDHAGFLRRGAGEG